MFSWCFKCTRPPLSLRLSVRIAGHFYVSEGVNIVWFWLLLLSHALHNLSRINLCLHWRYRSLSHIYHISIPISSHSHNKHKSASKLYLENIWNHRWQKGITTFCSVLNNIKKTYLYSCDPLKPHFYTCIIKLEFTEVYIIFLISA